MKYFIMDIRQIIKEEVYKMAKEGFFDGFNFEDEPYDGGHFDRTEFQGPAKKGAKVDIEDDGQEFVDLGDSKYEKKMDPEDFVSDLERANLRLPSDEKEVEDIQGKLDKKKQAKDSMAGMSLNEDKGKNYMSPQNLKNIMQGAEFLLTQIDADSAIEDWVEDKISKVAENM